MCLAFKLDMVNMTVIILENLEDTLLIVNHLRCKRQANVHELRALLNAQTGYFI